MSSNFARRSGRSCWLIDRGRRAGVLVADASELPTVAKKLLGSASNRFRRLLTNDDMPWLGILSWVLTVLGAPFVVGATGSLPMSPNGENLMLHHGRII